MSQNIMKMIVGIALVTTVFEKTKTKGEKKQPWWKRTRESQVKELNKDLGRPNALLEGKYKWPLSKN